MDYVQHVRDKLTTDEARMAYDLYVREARLPEAMALSVNATAEGMAKRGYGWHRTSTALLEMAASGARFNAAILRGFAERVPEAPTYDTALEARANFLVLMIQTARLYEANSSEEARAKIIGYGREHDTPENWNDLIKVNPGSLDYIRCGTDRERVLYVMEKLNGR